MLHKLNTIIRLLVVGLLIYPMPIAMGAEITVNEDFSDSTYQAGLTISGGSQDAYIYSAEQGSYSTTGSALAITSGTYTFTFSSDIKVYEVGFMIGAVNNAYSVTWNYADSTSQTENKSAQSTSNGYDNMYDDFYKSFTDYNAVTENTDKFITSFAVTLTDISLLDTLYWQYDDSVSTGSFATTTTTVLTSGIGDPTNLTTSANLHNGSISIDWDAATGYQTNAERYAVAFSNDNFQSMNYAVATGNVGGPNALNTEYTFTKTYLDSEFDVGDTIYFKVRADNDTNSQYSNWTSIASYVIQDVASGVTNVAITNNEYQGLKLGWTQPNTGWSTVESYRIEYKLSSVETYTGINIADASTVSYLIEDIEGGTYDFVVYSCTQSGSWCHGPQAGPSTNFEVLNTTAVTTTTTTTIYVAPPPPPPPPPPAPEEIIVDVVIEGVDKTYTQADVNDGTTTRDQERADNEDMYGCFMTNAQIERGDCVIIILEEITDEEIIIEEDIIKDKSDVDDIIFEDDDTILDTLPEEILEDEEGDTLLEEDFIILEDEEVIILTEEEFDDFIKELEDEMVEFEEQIIILEDIEFDLEDIITEDLVEIPISDEAIEDEEIKEDVKEVFNEPIEEIIEEELPLPVEEDGVFGDLFKDEVEEVQLTEEEVEILVTEVEEAITEVIEVEEILVEIIEEEELETLSEEEVEEYVESVEEAVAEVVAELETEELVEVVEQVAEVDVQNLATADVQTKAIVKAVVQEVTKVETVAELNEEEKQAVGEVLGFSAETAAEDVEIIAEQAAKEENVATAVEEYVDRAIENKDVEDYTLADVVTEVQVEVFLENPVGALIDVKITEMDLGSLGDDMTSDQRQKSKEVVVPVIIASQIIAQAGALITRRF